MEIKGKQSNEKQKKIHSNSIFRDKNLFALISSLTW